MPVIFLVLIALSVAARADDNSYWYFCKDNRLYYPDTATCPSPWVQVAPPAQPDVPDYSNAVPDSSPNSAPAVNLNVVKQASPSTRPPECDLHLEYDDPESVRQEKLIQLQACWRAGKQDAVNLQLGLLRPSEFAEWNRLKQEDAYDPATKTYYCGAHQNTFTGITEEEGREWCAVQRGDPEAVKRAKERQAGLEQKNAELIRQTQAHASPRLLEVEKREASLAHSYVLANAAFVCRFRSTYWDQSILMAISPLKTSWDNENGLSPVEIAAAEMQWKHAVNEENQKYPMTTRTCDRLFNSPALERLDDIQRQVTGNYH